MESDTSQPSPGKGNAMIPKTPHKKKKVTKNHGKVQELQPEKMNDGNISNVETKADTVMKNFEVISQQKRGKLQ
jgi:hypothetical protein